MSSSHTLVRVSILVGVCLLLGAGGVAVADASEHTTNQTDNGTLHENPEDVGERGDLASVQNWLGGRMTEIHLDCAQNLSLQEEIACDRLDEEYPEFLERYGSVERDRTGGDNTTRTFEQARENQSALANETEEFRETYEEYQDAREAGDEERSRRLARDLGESAERIDTLGESLDTLFLLLAEQTGRDFSEVRLQTNQTVTEVLEITTEVQEVEFRPATLTADIDAETASFRSPATVSGRLSTENGSGLSDREIRIVVDNRTVTTTETDAFGGYEATYQPVTTTTGPTTVRAVYDPSGADEYLGTEATAEVDVEASRPSLSAEVGTSSAAFGDAIPVSGSVTVLGAPVPDVPLSVYLDGQLVATGRTDGSGEFELEGTVPATVPDGEQTLAVRASRPETAIEPSYENRSTTIEETETNLSLVGFLDGEELVLRGVLTADGRPVPAQRVDVSVDAEARNVVRTNGDGVYESRVPRETGDDGVWSITVTYNDTESNLAPASTTDWLRANDLEATNGTERNTGGVAGQIRQGLAGAGLYVYVDGLTDRQLVALAASVLGLVVLGLLGLAYYLRRRWSDEAAEAFDDDLTPAFVRASDADDGSTADADDGSTADAEGAAPAASEPTLNEALAVARARLGNGDPAEAVEIGYGVVRRELGNGADDTRTHWEFYRDCEAELPDEQVDALERLTEAYEKAAFAPHGPSYRTARAALEAASECLTPSASPDGGAEESS